MPEGPQPCAVPAARAGLSLPQPPITAVPGRVSQPRDRQLQSGGAAAEAAELVHQVSHHTWHTTRVYRRCTQGTCIQTQGRPTPSAQAGQTHTSTEQQPAGAYPQHHPQAKAHPTPRKSLLCKQCSSSINKRSPGLCCTHGSSLGTYTECMHLQEADHGVLGEPPAVILGRHPLSGWEEAHGKKEVGSQCQAGLSILSFHSTMGDGLTSSNLTN